MAGIESNLLLQPFENLYVQRALACPSIRLGKDEKLESILFDYDIEEALYAEASDIQAICTIGNVRKARRLADLLISENGELSLSKVRLTKELLEAYPFTLAPSGKEFRKRDQVLIRALYFLSEDTEAQRLLRRISRPLHNRLAEQAIRDTLALPDSEVVNDTHVKKAVLAALFTTLRQSLGSCFATAPAIIVHEWQQRLFLQDLDELMSTSKLKRVVSGNEYSVPMSASWGQGDLKKPIILTSPLKQSPRPIWVSPTLIRTLQALELLPQQTPREAQASLFHLLETIFSPLLAAHGSLVTHVDDILQRLLMHSLHISEKELQEYVDRPKAMQHTETVVSQPTSTRRDEQDKRIITLLALQEKGRRLFKMEGDCALLKTWEFTLASFSEVKFDFCKWNFYSSLGVNWDDAGGIGQVLYETAKQRVEETNRELQEHKEKFDAISTEIDYLDRRLQQASSETEMQWVKIEYQSRMTEQYHIRQLCEMAAEKTNKVTSIHQFLIDQYDRLMQQYFQEIYDADLHDIQANQFDDSPAGFRLIYKHGRTNPSLWTKITSLNEYVEALVSFFTITEQELLHHPAVNGIETEFSSIITKLATHVRSEAFLESAFARTAYAHGVQPIADPLHNLQLVEKKPWVYTSGGSMNNLVSSYFGLDRDVEEIGRWVENETELFAFLIDTARQSIQRAAGIPCQAILMHSPTHAFLLSPSQKSFRECLTGDEYSYSWIARNCRDPGLNFYASCVLDPAAVSEFCSFLAAQLPSRLRMRFLDESQAIQGFIRPHELAKEIQRLFSLDAVLRLHEPFLEQISLETLLFESVPYTPADSVKEAISSVLSTVLSKDLKKKIPNNIPLLSRAPIRSKDLLYLIQATAISALNTHRLPTDLFEAIVNTMREQRLLPPQPIIFADSNWVKDFFAFVFSPVSQQIELWSTNAYGTEGAPIKAWKQWLNGSRRDRTWGMFVQPRQYHTPPRTSGGRPLTATSLTRPY